MKWEIAEDRMTPVGFYELLERHRLLPHSPEMLPRIADMANAARFFEITDNGTTVGHVVVSGIIPHHSADFDLIPNPVYFKRGQYEDVMLDCLLPVVSAFFESGIGRLNSAVPESRSRTKHALLALGFRKEGVMRRAARFRGRHAEDVLIMGMIASDMREPADILEQAEVCDGTV